MAGDLDLPTATRFIDGRKRQKRMVKCAQALVVTAFVTPVLFYHRWANIVELAPRNPGTWGACIRFAR
jgi:hypothetical protein